MQLELLVEGRLADPKASLQQEAADRRLPAGTPLEPIEVEFETLGAKWSLHGHFEGGLGVSFTGSERPEFTQHCTPRRLRRRGTQRVAYDDETGRLDHVPLGPHGWRADWYISGPHSDVYCRGTKRRRTATYSRESEFGALDVEESPTGRTRYFDHLIVETEGLRFAVTKVPEDVAPPWCWPISIEFRAPVPEADTREAVAEIVSFVLGRRLMPVGSTLFDDAGWPIEEEVVSPWGLGIERLCREGDAAPVPLEAVSDEAERILAWLVPRYLAARSILRLNDALLTYWNANETVTGIDLMLYGSALESLKKSWFESTGSKSKGLHVSKTEYEEVLGDLLATIRSRLDERGMPRAITNRIASANQMGGNEQLAAFFAEIGLVIGEAERAAIKARNVPTHVLRCMPRGRSRCTLVGTDRDARRARRSAAALAV